MNPDFINNFFYIWISRMDNVYYQRLYKTSYETYKYTLPSISKVNDNDNITGKYKQAKLFIQRYMDYEWMPKSVREG